jgi:regulator of sigma E protease
VENYRNGERRVISVSPYYNKELKRAVIGINLLDTVILKYRSVNQKLFSGFMHSYNIMGYNFSTIGQLVQLAVREKRIEPVSQTVSGPIGIYSVVNDLVTTSGQKMVKNLLNIIGLLSLSLAVMNVLPLPALDGGRLVFILYEWITGRRVNKTLERNVNLVGFLVIISLGILVSINDIVRIFK